jgi:hypothetical protein
MDENKGLTAEQAAKVAELEVQHGTDKILVIEVKDAVAYVKKPGRNIVGRILKEMDVDPVKAFELYLNSCWVEGDKRILDDDNYFFGAFTTMGEILSFEVGTLKKK